MNEIKVKKINPIEDSINEYEFLNNAIEDYFQNTSFNEDDFYPRIIEEYNNKNNFLAFLLIPILLFININAILNNQFILILFLLSIFLTIMCLIHSNFFYKIYKIVKKIKNKHMDLFYPLKNDEIISIIRENYSKKDEILYKMGLVPINKFEINKIIGQKNPDIITDNIKVVNAILREFYFSNKIYEKKKKIEENQKEIIDIVNSPDFLNNKYFNVEYGVENGPQLQEYLEGDKKDIIDYINDKCLKEYNRESSFIKITC